MATISSSPFSQLPEELLVLILDNLCAVEDIKRTPTKVTWNPWEAAVHSCNLYLILSYHRGLNFRILGHLRLAVPEYTHLPSLLTLLFESTGIMASAKCIKAKPFSHLSTIEPYVLKVAFNNVYTSYDRSHDFDIVDVKTVWTALLRQLPNVWKFRIGQFSEDPFIGAILDSFTAAETMVTDLSIGSRGGGDFAWASSDRLTCLSDLKTLVFSPGCGIPMDPRPAAKALTAILEKSANSIQELTMGEGFNRSWPLRSQPCVALPVLRSLDIRGWCISLNLRVFAAFLRESCPSLEVLKLHDTNGQYWVWHDVWDAIRLRPRRMHVTLEDLLCGNYGPARLRRFLHFTGEESRQLQCPGPFADVRHSLAMYLSSMGEWDESLGTFFDAGDDWEVGEESDEEGNWKEAQRALARRFGAHACEDVEY